MIENLLLQTKKLYEMQQSFETITIDILDLFDQKKMYSFVANGTNGKSLSLFSIISTNEGYPIKLIFEDATKIITKREELKYLSRTISQLLSKRNQILNSHDT